MSMEVRVSDVNAHPPTGVIMGNSNDYDELDKFFRSEQGGCRLRGVSSEPDREEYRSESVTIKRISIRRFPADERSYVYQPIGFFQMDDFSISRRLIPPIPTTRTAVFHLTGPSDVWPIVHSRSTSYLGKTDTRVVDPALRIARLYDVKVRVRPHFFQPTAQHVEQLADPHQSLLQAMQRDCDLLVEAGRLSLEISDREPDRSEDEFISRATEIAERLCLAASFIAEARIDWYARQLWSSDKLETVNRRAEEQRSNITHWNESIIDFRELRKFFSISFGRSPSRAAEENAERLPIVFYVNAVQMNYVDERFITLFRVLEMLVGEASRTISKNNLPTSQQQDELRRGVTELLKTAKIRQPYRSIASEKLNSLFVPTFRRRLTAYLKRNRINYSDVGGDAGLSSMVALRNQLIHGAREPNIRRIIRESGRVETIVQRALLRRFGWKKESNTPSPTNRSRMAITDKD